MTGPVGVEEFALGAIGALVGVCAEVVALRLDDVSGSRSAAEAVEVGETGGDGGRGDADGGGLNDDAAPTDSALGDLFREEGIEEQVGEVGVGLESLEDVLQVLGANDATAAPHEGDAAEVEVPFEVGGGLAHEYEALRARDEEGRVHGVAHVVNELLFVALELVDGGSLEDVRSEHAVLLLRRQAATEHGLSDERHGNAQIQRVNARPLARTLLARSVQDVVYDVLAFLVLFRENRCRDLHQIRVQVALVPIVEDFRHLVVREAQHVLQQIVCLRNRLAARVFVAIVHHLHVVAGSFVSDPIAARRSVFYLRRDGLEDGLDVGPSLLRSSRHDRGTIKRALLSS